MAEAPEGHWARVCDRFSSAREWSLHDTRVLQKPGLVQHQTGHCVLLPRVNLGKVQEASEDKRLEEAAVCFEHTSKGEA